MFLCEQCSEENIVNHVSRISEGTVFEGMEEIYENNSEFSAFLQEFNDNRDELFIGYRSSMFVQGDLEYKALLNSIERHDKIHYIDFLIFLKDYVEFIYERLESNCESDLDVIEEIVHFNEKRGAEREKMYNQLLSKYHLSERDIGQERSILDTLEYLVIRLASLLRFMRNG